MKSFIRIGLGSLKRRYRREVRYHQNLSTNSQPRMLTEQDIAHLPVPVRSYLRVCGILGAPGVNSFKVELAGRLRKKSNQAWMPFHSEQHNFMNTTARLFFMDARMKHLPVSGYHYFRNGVAYMDIRLLSMFRVQYAAGDALNKAETVTFFNDMCCLAPATLIDPRITWTEVNDTCVSATFTNRGISVLATLYFNERHELVNFVSDDRGALTDAGDFLPLRWSTPLGQHDDRLGYHLPRHAQAVYNYEDGPFAYGEFEIVKITYNI
jgi:hypothetical protein